MLKARSEPENVEGRINITVQGGVTMRTIVETLGKFLRNFFSTAGTDLARVTSWHFDDLSSSFFRFEAQNFKEVEPACVSHGPIQRSECFPVVQFFDANQAVLTDIKIGDLEKKIFSLAGNMLMQNSDRLSDLCSSLRSFYLSCKMLLKSLQAFCTSSHESWCLHLSRFTVGHKVDASHVKADGLRGDGQQSERNIFAGKDCVPFSGHGFFDGDIFDRPLNGTMKPYSEQSKLFDNQLVFFESPSCLFQDQAVITIFGFESWITRCFSRFNSSKKILEGFVKTFDNFLQSLGRHIPKFWMIFFQNGQGLGLFKSGNGLLVFVPC